MQDVPVIRRQRHGINQVTLSASVPSEMARKVEKLAGQRVVSKSLVVTEALKMYFTVVPVTVTDEEAA